MKEISVLILSPAASPISPPAVVLLTLNEEDLRTLLKKFQDFSSLLELQPSLEHVLFSNSFDQLRLSLYSLKRWPASLPPIPDAGILVLPPDIAEKFKNNPEDPLGEFFLLSAHQWKLVFASEHLSFSVSEYESSCRFQSQVLKRGFLEDLLHQVIS